jgi:hypothetical protein
MPRWALKAMPQKRRYVLWLVFTLLVVWISGTRWMLRHEPFERDIAAYAVAGRELLEGRSLYSDIWDHKPPGIHLVFAGATMLVGPGAPGVLLINVFLSVVVAGGLMYAGDRAAGTSGAIVSGLLWAIVGSDLGLQANQPNVELALNACLAWALAASLGDRQRLTRVSAWVTGATTACGLILKTVIAAPLGFLAAVDICDRWRKRGAPRAIGYGVRWLTAVMLVLVPIIAWCVHRAGPEAVWDALIGYNLAYTRGDLLTNLLGVIRIDAHLPTNTVVLLGLLASPGIIGLLALDPRGRRRILVALAGSVLAIAAPGRFHPHYYQLLLPPMIVAGAIGVAHLLGQPGVKRLVAIGGLAVLGTIQLQNYLYSPDDWSREKYGEVFLDERRLADYLKPRLEPGQYFWQLAPQPGLYLLTETVPASGVIYDFPLLPGSPLRDQLAARVVADLAEHRPEFIVVRKLGGDRGVLWWIREHYRLVAAGRPVAGYQLWRLNRREGPSVHGPGNRRPEHLIVDGFEDGNLNRWSGQVKGNDGREQNLKAP